MSAGTDRVRREHGFHRLHVARVIPETADAATFVLDVPDGLEQLFRYRPGQFCTFRVPIDSEDHLRSYSMSSAPGIDPAIAVTVKRVPGGLVSNWMHDRLSVGDEIEATPPAGVFCPRETGRPLLAYCAGSGVTPVMSITKSVLAGTDRTVRWLYANRERAAVIFADQLAGLGARHPERFRVHHHLDDAGGFVDAAEVEAFVGADLDADHYLCGPAPFMDLVEAVLVDLGVGEDRLFTERFGDAHHREHDGGEPAGGAGPAGPGSTESDSPESVAVILGGQRTEIPYRVGETVLDTARRGGLRAPSSCEAGNCATCMAMLREGGATMRTNHALTAEEVAEGWILTCQAVPSGRTVVVEYESL